MKAVGLIEELPHPLSVMSSGVWKDREGTPPPLCLPWAGVESVSRPGLAHPFISRDMTWLRQRSTHRLQFLIFFVLHLHFLSDFSLILAFSLLLLLLPPSARPLPPPLPHREVPIGGPRTCCWWPHPPSVSVCEGAAQQAATATPVSLATEWGQNLLSICSEAPFHRCSIPAPTPCRALTAR